LIPLAKTLPGSEYVGLDVRPGKGTQTLYAIDATLKDLVTIDRTTAAISNLGNVSPFSGESFSDLSFDPTDGTLYACSTGANFTRASIYTVNSKNGSTFRIGPVPGATGLSGIAIDQSGNMYGIDVQSNSLVRIDKTNGNSAVVGSLGSNYYGSKAIDFNPVSGVLYGAMYNTASSTAQLVSLDTSSGFAGVLGILGATVPGGSILPGGFTIASDLVPTPTPVPTSTPSSTPTPSATPSESPTPSVTPTESETPTPSPTPTPFNDAALLNHNLPGELHAGTQFIAGVTMRNTGNTTWSIDSGYYLYLVSDSCGIFPVSLFGMDFGVAVAPGDQFLFYLPIQVPQSLGSCTIQLQMGQAGVAYFGQQFQVNANIVPTPNAVNGWSDYE